MGSHGDAGFHLNLDTVLRHAVDRRAATGGIGAIDHARIDGSAHRLDDRFAGTLGREIDGACTVPVELDAGFLRGDERLHGGDNIAAGEVVRLDVVDGDFNAGFLSGNTRIHDQAERHLPQLHRKEIEHTDGRTRQHGPQPYAEEREDDRRTNEDDDAKDDKNNISRIHNFVTVNEKFWAPVILSRAPRSTWPSSESAS